MERTLCRGFFAIVLLVGGYAFHIGGTATTDLTPEARDRLQALITTSELVVGQNRFAFGLLNDNKLVEGADVTVRVYSMKGEGAQLDAELKAPYRATGNAKGERLVHRHADGTEHVHGEGSLVRGLYLAQLTFARAGTWGIEILAHHQKAGWSHAARTAVTVLDTSHTPAVGSAAPRSRNLIASDVKNLRQIDTSQRPDPRLHQVRIADAIEQGKPTASGLPLRIRKFGRILPRRKCFQRSKNGA